MAKTKKRESAKDINDPVRIYGSDIKEVYPKMAWNGGFVDKYEARMKDGSTCIIPTEDVEFAFRQCDYLGMMARKYLHLTAEAKKVHTFIDSRHNHVYNVRGAKNLKEAREKLKKKIVGDIWDADVDDDELWYYVTYAKEMEIE